MSTLPFRRPPALLRRSFLVALVVAAAGLGPGERGSGVARADGARPTLYVLLQIDAKLATVEKMLADHLPALSVKVFATYRDFDGAAASGHPDAVVLIPPVLEARGKKATLQGLRAGKDWEPYVLASVGKPLEGPLSGKTIGVVDLLGRDGTQAFVAQLVKAADVKVKRVAKVEDLLPLLEFSAADAVLVPSAMLAKFSERTRLVLKTRELPDGHVGLPAVAVLNPAVHDTVVKAFGALDPGTKAILGVDSWSAK
jgi:hypothetical protein